MRNLFVAVIVALTVVVGAQNGGSSRDDYEFKFDAGSHFREETKGEDGITRGRYGFRTPDGCMHVVRYQANTAGGYRVLGSTKEDCIAKVRRPFVRTTTTRRPPTTTTTTTRRPPTTTTPAPRNVFPVRPVPQVDNAIEASKPSVSIEEPQGRQLRRPNLTTQRPAPTTTTTTTTTTPKPKDDEPEPAYTFGYTAPAHGHTETGQADGSKKGEYYWDSPDGWRRIVTYIANEKGFFPKIRRVRIPTTTTTTSTVAPPPEEEGVPGGKNLDGPDSKGEIPVAAQGCPYFFYYNTRMNYHWEQCHLNGTKTGQFGHLGTDGYEHRNTYYADATGFHPKLSKIPLDEKQRTTVAEWQAGAFIIPKPDEERRNTEKRILKWLEENRRRLNNPL